VAAGAGALGACCPQAVSNAAPDADSIRPSIVRRLTPRVADSI
jgi:hypothetical protein